MAVTLSFSTTTATSIYVSFSGLSGTNYGSSITCTTTGASINGTGGTFSGLSCGTTYTFRGDYDTSGNGFGSTSSYSKSTSACAISVGSVPSVSVGTVTTSSVPLSWGSATNATSYDVVTRNNSGSQVGSTVNTASTSTTISGLSTYTYYSFTVTPKNGSTTGGSASTSATTKDALAGAMTGFTTSNPSKTTIDLSWSATSNVNIYVVEYGTTTSYGYTSTYDNLTTSATISGLSAGTTYYFKAYAKNRDGVAGTSQSASRATTALVLPSSLSGLISTGQTSSTIDLQWSQSANATSYYIAWVKTAGGGAGSKTVSTLYTSVTGLSPNTSYNLTVTPRNSDGDGGSQTITSSTTVLPPNAPTGLTVTGQTDTTVSLSWTAGLNATSYDINWGSTGANTTGTTYTATGLTPKTIYTFYVNSKNSGGVSSQVNVQGGTNPPKPSALTGLNATADSSTAITLSWTASTDATNYNISWTGGGTGSTSSTTTSKQIVGLLEGKSYTFTVTPTNITGSGTSASITKATKDLTAPTVSTPIVSFSGGTMNVSWTASDNIGINTIRVYITNSTGTYFAKGVYTAGTTSASYTNDGSGSAWLNGYSYSAKVEVTDTGGLITTSNPASATYTKPAPIAPSAPTIVSKTYQSVDISWNSVSGASAYDVLYKKTSDTTWLTSAGYTTTTTQIQGLAFNTSYDIKVQSKVSDDAGGYIMGGTSPSASFTTDPPPDTTPPELSITSTNGQGTVQFSWTATDTGVGMKSTATYQVFISSKGGTTFSATPTQTMASTQTNYTFTKDKDGLDFVDKSYYMVKVIAYDANNNASSATANIQYIYVDRVPPTVTINSTNGNETMNVTWTASDNVALRTSSNPFELKISGADVSFTQSKTTLGATATSYTFTSDGNGLAFKHNSTYIVEVGANDTSNNYGFAQASVVYTLTPPSGVGSLVASNISGTGFKINWNPATNATVYQVEYKLSTNGTYIVATSNLNTTTYTFSGLQAGKSYDVKVFAKRATGLASPNDYINGSASTVVVSTGARPANFAWTTAKVQGQNLNLTFSEWNNFTTKINSFRTYKGITTYTFTTVTTGNTLTALIFNQAVTAINAMSPPTLPPTTKNKDDEILASYFNILRDSLNSIL